MTTYLDELIGSVQLGEGKNSRQVYIPEQNPYEVAGVDPQVVKNITEWQPGTPFIDNFRTQKAPEAPDPKKAKNNLRVAAISQALGTLAEAFAAGKGAHVQRRTDASPVAAVAENQRRLEDLYQQKLAAYEEAGVQANLQDALYKEKFMQNKSEEEKRKAEIAENEKKSKAWWYEQQGVLKDKAIDLQENSQENRKEIKIEFPTDKTPKKPEMTPERRAEITKVFATVDPEFLVKMNVYERVVNNVLGSVDNGKVTYKLKQGTTLTDEMKEEYIRQWDASRKPAPTTTTQSAQKQAAPAPKAQPQPAKPAVKAQAPKGPAPAAPGKDPWNKNQKKQIPGF